MENKSRKYIRPVIITGFVLIATILILTANYWVWGILSLLFPDYFDIPASKLEPLMEQYLEYKYDGKMKLDSVHGTVSSWKLLGYAHRRDKTSINFYVYYNKNKDGSYEFNDNYYEEYIRYKIDEYLNPISKQVCKEYFKLGHILMMEFGEKESEELAVFGVDVSLEECKNIIKYTFLYEVDLYGGFDESKIDFMYDLLKNIYKSGVVPYNIWYNFDSSATVDYTLSESDKNGDLIGYEDFKNEILADYNK